MTPLLHATDVKVRIGDVEILHGADLTVRAGELVAIVGRRCRLMSAAASADSPGHSVIQ